jgi:hypothetical protein
LGSVMALCGRRSRRAVTLPECRVLPRGLTRGPGGVTRSVRCASSPARPSSSRRCRGIPTLSADGFSWGLNRSVRFPSRRFAQACGAVALLVGALAGDGAWRAPAQGSRAPALGSFTSLSPNR